MRWSSHFAGDEMSLVHAASATELSRLAVFLNSRLVCVSGLIIAISPFVSSGEQLNCSSLPPLRSGRACLRSLRPEVALRSGNTAYVLSHGRGPFVSAAARCCRFLPWSRGAVLGASVEASCSGHGVASGLDEGVGGVDESGADGFGDGHGAVGVDIAGGDPNNVFAAVTAVDGAVDVGVGPVGHGTGRAGEVGVLGGDVADHAGDVDCGGQGLLEVVGGFAQVDATGHDVWASPGGHGRSCRLG